jgi:rRNA maturation RNase YbeY
LKNLSVSTSKNIKVEKKIIHSLITNLSSKLSFKLESLSINFVDAEYLLNINKDYLNHNFNTDIITFNYSGSNSLLDGELFISVDEAINNSLKFKVTLDSEIIRLVIHGILHLLGFDDEETSKKRKMKKEEDFFTELFEKEYKNIIVEYDY